MKRIRLTVALAVAGSVLLGAASDSRPSSLGFGGVNGRIAFARFLPDEPKIFAASPRGTNVTQLVRHAGQDGEPSWSRDGKMIAFTSLVPDGTQGIYVATARGTRVRRVISHRFDPASQVLDSSPRWSPDGRWLLFHRYRQGAPFELLVVSIDGRRLRKLGEGFQPAWSPDGRRIAFAFRESEADDYDLYVMSREGSNRRRLTASPEGETAPDWSPDGRRIAFVRQRGLQDYDIYSMRSDGKQLRRLTTAPATTDVSPAWSPDGRLIAFASRGLGQRWDILVMRADGSRKRRLISSPLDDVEPAWQPLPKRS